MAAVQSTGTSSNDLIASLTGKSSTTKTQSSNEQIQDRFLTLLVTQLKNQDPLNPMDNAQVTSQLSQINTVSGIEKLNTTLSKMFDIYDSGQAMQAAGLIGKHVLVSGNTLPLSGGQAVGGVSLPEAADNVSVSIVNAAGEVVETRQLGARDAGNFAFSWDGAKADGSKYPDGNYSFKIDAQRGGKKVEATGMQVGTVYAVVRNGSGFQLDLGTLGNVGFKDVQQIL